MIEIRKTLPAALDAIEPFVLEFRALCGCLPTGSDRFAAELLLREALTNAVVHGSRNDPGRQVRCAVRISRRELRIAVEDDGGGFDWRGAGKGACEPAPTSGRGLEILRKYATSVWFNSTGNAARIIKRFEEAKKS